MSDYKPNSHRFKEEQSKKEISKVVSGNAVQKKKSGFSKLASTIVSDDANNVKDYILDVLVSATKKAIQDIVSNGIDIILYGESRGSRTYSSNATYVSYDKYSYKDDRYRPSSRVSSRYSFDDIVLSSRADAERVLDAMDNIINEYDAVSVADLCELVGVQSNYTDNKYGWTNLRNADVQRVRDGYILRLPRVTPID